MKQTREPISKGRLEAFTDGVIAVIITILVLNLHAPSVGGWAGWRPGLLPVLIYGIGFQLTAAMWLLHHNTMVRLAHVNRRAVWANLVFLFLLSLFPVTVQAVSLHPQSSADVVVFCGDAALCGLALSVMRWVSAKDHVGDADFQQWSERRQRLAFAGLGSVVLALLSAFISTYLSLGLMACALVLVLITG